MNEHLVQIALRFKERSEHLGYKGKKRDDAALDFACGYCSALSPADQEAVTIWLILDLSVRGYAAIGEVLRSVDAKAA